MVGFSSAEFDVDFHLSGNNEARAGAHRVPKTLSPRASKSLILRLARKELLRFRKEMSLLKIRCVGEGGFVEEFCLSVFDTFSNHWQDILQH